MIYNPPTILTAQRTFYVSPSFPASASPYFQTIQAAVNACDGVNPSTVYVYPGTYLETPTLKHNVTLVGVDRANCIISNGGAAGNTLTFTTTAINQFSSVQNLYVLSNGAGNSAYEVIANHNGTTVKVYNSTLDATATQIGLKFTNNGGGVQNLDAAFSTLQGAAAQPFGGIAMNCAGQGPLLKVRYCLITGAEYVYNCNDFAFEHCRFEAAGIKIPDAGYFKQYRHCEFRAANPSIGATNDATVQFTNCTFREFTIAITAGAAQLLFTSCSFIAQATDTAFISISGGTGALKLYHCDLNNGKIVFGAAVTNYLSAIDTIVRNGGAGLAIESGAFAVTVMLGNFSSDKALGANVTQNANAFNVQLTKPI